VTRDAALAAAYTTSVLLVLAWTYQSVGYSQAVDPGQMLTTSGAVLLGAAALGWMRPPRVGLTAPQAMLLLGAVGMSLGLVVDSRLTPLGTLASLCSRVEGGLWPMVRLHASLLPWMHVGMWVGGLAAIPLLRAIRPACRTQYCARVFQNVACSAWMTVGMSAGVLVSEYFVSQSGLRSAGSMLGGMFSGMVWGMVASVSLYRLYHRVRPVIACKLNQRRIGAL